MNPSTSACTLSIFCRDSFLFRIATSFSLLSGNFFSSSTWGSNQRRSVHLTNKGEVNFATQEVYFLMKTLTCTDEQVFKIEQLRTQQQPVVEPKRSTCTIFNFS